MAHPLQNSRNVAHSFTFHRVVPCKTHANHRNPMESKEGTQCKMWWVCMSGASCWEQYHGNPLNLLGFATFWEWGTPCDFMRVPHIDLRLLCQGCPIGFHLISDSRGLYQLWFWNCRRAPSIGLFFLNTYSLKFHRILWIRIHFARSRP